MLRAFVVMCRCFSLAAAHSAHTAVVVGTGGASKAFIGACCLLYYNHNNPELNQTLRWRIYIRIDVLLQTFIIAHLNAVPCSLLLLHGSIV